MVRYQFYETNSDSRMQADPQFRSFSWAELRAGSLSIENVPGSRSHLTEKNQYYQLNPYGNQLKVRPPNKGEYPPSGPPTPPVRYKRSALCCLESSKLSESSVFCDELDLIETHVKFLLIFFEKRKS